MEGCKTLVEATADKLVQEILKRNMKAGDRLPNEYELAEYLGVGRSTLRESIRRLVSRNVLEVRQGAGTFVSNKRGVPEDPLGLIFLGQNPKVALDLLDVRLMLEPEICALVAVNATAEQIARLERLADQLETLIEAGEDYTDVDIQIHSYLAECSGNCVLQNLIPIIASSVRVEALMTDREHRQMTLRLHRQIVDAVCRHDPMGARLAMTAHLDTSRDYLARVLPRQEEDAG